MPTLYWKNAALDNAWENILNWFTDAAATIQATSVPWAQDDAYKAYDLALADGEPGGGIGISSIGLGDSAGTWAITGTCNIPGLVLWSAPVYGGTFSGDGLIIGVPSTIYGGTFSGDGVTNYGTIYDGVFSGIGFYNEPDANINGGSFAGDGATNSGTISGGMFSGSNLVINGGSIYGGTFSGAGLFCSAIQLSGGTFVFPACTRSFSGGSVSVSVTGFPGTFILPYPDILGAGLL